MKTKTVYCLRIRFDEIQPWHEAEYYRTRKERDHDERMNRCLGGIRTHSYEEKKTKEQIEELLNPVVMVRERAPETPEAVAKRISEAGGVGEGWVLLKEGEPLQEGDGYLSPDYPYWIDYACRPAIFRGGGDKDCWYYVPQRDYAHTWPWRRKNPPQKGRGE